MNIVFLGSGDIGIPALNWLLASGDDQVCAVVTQPDRPAGRGLQLTPCAIKEVSLARSLPPLQPSRIRTPEAVAQIASLQPDLLVVMAYGQILPPDLLGVPKLGALNLHASLLPRHRGAAPVHAAVLAGDEKSGITVMWMDEGLDTGDILLMRECDVSPGETAGTLHDKLAELAPLALADALALVRAGRASRIRQDEAVATYAPKLDRRLGVVDWRRSAVEIDRLVRGLHPWPGSTAEFEMADGKRTTAKLHRVENADGDTPAGELASGGGIGCGGGGVLKILEIQPSGGKRMSWDDFLRGHRVVRAVLPSGGDPA